MNMLGPIPGMVSGMRGNAVTFTCIYIYTYPKNTCYSRIDLLSVVNINDSDMLSHIDIVVGYVKWDPLIISLVWKSKKINSKRPWFNG